MFFFFDITDGFISILMDFRVFANDDSNIFPGQGPGQVRLVRSLEDDLIIHSTPILFNDLYIVFILICLIFIFYLQPNVECHVKCKFY